METPDWIRRFKTLGLDGSNPSHPAGIWMYSCAIERKEEMLAWMRENKLLLDEAPEPHPTILHRRMVLSKIPKK